MIKFKELQTKLKEAFGFKKEPICLIPDPGSYPKNKSEIDDWMKNTVEFYKVKYPTRVWTLFCPTMPDYLPVRVRVGTSTETMDKHMESYIKLRDENPKDLELARTNYDPNNKFPNGPFEDYSNKFIKPKIKP